MPIQKHKWNEIKYKNTLLHRLSVPTFSLQVRISLNMGKKEQKYLLIVGKLSRGMNDMYMETY